MKYQDQARRIFTSLRIAVLALVGLSLVQTVFGQNGPAPLSAVGVSTQETHKIQVNDAAQGARIVALGGRLIGDYGSYQLYEAQGVAGADAEVRDEYNVVMLNAGHLDTRKTEAKALRKTVGNFAGKRMHLVQFAGPVQPAWHDELVASGVKVVAYIPQNAYLVYGDAKGIAQLQGLAASAPHIQWDAPYLDEYKIHPAARLVDTNDEFQVQLVEDTEANPATLQLLNQLKLGPVRQPGAIPGYVNLVVRVAPENLGLLAAQPDVVSILPSFPRKKLDERQDQIIAGNLTGSVPSSPGYLAWLASKGFTQAQFTASGFVVDVADSGVDDGTTLPHHFGLFVGGSVSNASRVVYNRLEGTPNGGSTLHGCDGHGNLNTHIISGYDGLAGFPFADSSGYHYGLGVCPFVNVGSSVIFDPDTFTNPNFNTEESDAYAGGARISNNSWGSPGSAGAYDIQAQTYDALVRDAQSGVAGSQEMVIVFAAGNDGPTVGSASTPGTAKNVLTVGAAENVQAFGGADGSGVGDAQANSANDMISFSSRGPCADGRHKPEIVAPGTHVSGGVAQAASPGTDGTADPCYTGSGVSGGVGSIFFPAGQQFYTASSGTSHSTPCVSGGCALLRQYFINNFTNPPSPAMTKAFLMNSARYLTGVSANDTLWSDTQGMGEMNLGTAFDGTARILRDEVAADLFTASGQTRLFTGVVAETNKPFRVTVAWTDAPGSTTGNAFNNNLDLTVTVGGNTYKGNVFSGAFSATGGTADLKNNAESVFLPAGTAGVFQVRVAGTSINSVGVPNAGNVNEQDFALVVYNGTPTNLPVPAAAGATLIGETCMPTNGVIDSGETVTVNFSLQNAGTQDSSNLVATLQASGGVVGPSGAQTYGVLTGGGAAVSQPFTFTANGTCGGTITATLQLQDGATDLGVVKFNFTLGTFTTMTTFTQNFDGVTAPTLPAGWTSTASGAETPWVTSTSTKNTPPNSAFVKDPANIGTSDLLSPSISIASTNAQLTFRNDYNLESGFDGGVLEIKIGSGAFTDILAAGGSFAGGGYNNTISPSFGNVLAGRQAWTGNAGGYILTTVNLPAAAAGQNIVLRWRCGSDSSTSGLGWAIDTLSIQDGFYTCCGGTVDVGVSQSATTNLAIVGQNFSYNIVVTNTGATGAGGVTVTDALPATVTFVSASPGLAFSNGLVTGSLGTLSNGAGTNLTVTVQPTAGGSITNSVTVGTASTDTNLANNTSVLITAVNAAPVITSEPTDATVVQGTNVSFQVTATGSPAPGYQWFFNATNLLAGATSNVLTLTNVQPVQAGAYSVMVSNSAGATNSTAAQLTVLAPPTITNSPASQTVLAGADVSFQVGATGTGPLGFQWFFNGTNIATATASVLSLTNVQAAQMGDYTVTVTNGAGTVTSGPAHLKVLVTPTIANITVTGTNVTVSLSSLSGLNYTLEYKDALDDATWTPLAPTLSGTGGILDLQDTNPPVAGRYYRVRVD